MPDLTLFVEHWGYAAILIVVVLSNVGLPVPEETILALAGYLVWRSDLSFWYVVGLGVVSASIGNSVGYWLGLRFGAAAVHRYGNRIFLSPARLEGSQRFFQKYGAAAIVIARFLPGLRYAAGPIAGYTRMSAQAFMLANVLGACCYVPVVVGCGYAIGRGAGPLLERIRMDAIAVEHVVLAAAISATLYTLAMRRWRRSKMPRRPPAHD